MLEPGDIIDIWVIEKQLGSGGMGSVYRCHNRTATRIMAAVKSLDLTGARSPGAQERFIREAEILFALDHPNIVKVRNVRTDNDPPYLEMEFIRGESLEDILQRGPLPYPKALDYSRQLADALAYLHSTGVRHRDLKPANILIRDDGRLKIVDFGLAMESHASRITQAGMTFGTVSYAPPEWVNPDTLDPAKWDLYALGVCLWEMLTGDVAFPQSGQGSGRQQAMQVILAKQSHPPLDPGERFDPAMRRLIASLTQADPNLRAGSASDVADALRSMWKDFVARGAAPPSSDEITGADLDTESVLQRLEASGHRSEQRTWVLGADKHSATPPAPASQQMSASTKRRAAAAVAIGGVLLFGVVALTGAIAAVSMGVFDAAPPPATSRQVTVLVSGLPAGSAYHVQIGQLRPSKTEGFAHSFAEVPLHDTEIQWVVGDDCSLMSCPGSACAAWCVTGTSPLAVTAGDGALTAPLALALPAPREVLLSVPDLPEGVDVELRVTDRAGERVTASSARFELRPGRYELTASIGACPAEAAACQASASCPPGCASLAQELVVGVGDDALTQTIALAPPAAVTPEPTPHTPPVVRPHERTTDPPPPKPVVSGASGPVSYRAFAKWLQSAPDWTPEAAQAAGRADATYLSDWVDGAPPAGSDAAPIVNVPWYAASAFCRTRGGLAALDAEPLTWPNTPILEWRIADGKPAWRSNDGQPGTKVRMKDSNGMTGFRCAK